MIQKLVVAGSVVLFIIACNLPALEFRRNENGQEIWSGGVILLGGWLGIFLGQVAWYANPVWLFAVVLLLLNKRRACMICSLLALFISLTTWMLFGETIPGDEAGVNKLFLVRIREGTYVWQSSMVVLLVGAFFARGTPRSQRGLQPAGDRYDSGER